MVNYSLQGKTALVTGGTRGIGAAIVAKLLAAGATVVTTSRTPVDNLPAGVHYVQADLGTPEGATVAAEETLTHFDGKLDILVNNVASGQAYPAGTATIPDEAWQSSLNTSFLSSVWVTQRLLANLVTAKGAIVNISSAVTLDVVPPLAHYAAAKAALERYSLTLAAELAPQGVRLNVVIPGNVATPGGDKVRQDLADGFGIPVEAMTAGTPLGRAGIPTDIAEAVGFLVSDQAEWITGSQLLVDGGAAVGLAA
ncbi:oxidoreductase [Streptomyces sp. SID13031]|uniref:oxidoreductase n=1 Tax=Streptomyces sp. SID13031 TaxID=2706046 RepID=UPI0013CCF1E2|nr:oxidoreductase [Streptomyces sp. SID13031]NEA35412.1 SDR family oxidoreductase [Streptomyces sp. SID13031]